MGARGTLLDPADVQRPSPEVHLIPPQVHQLGRPQAVPIGCKDHRGVSVTPAVPCGRFRQPFDLGLGQVLAGAQVGIGGRLGLTVRFTVAGVTSLRCRLAMRFVLPKWLTVRTMIVLRTEITD